MPLLYHATSKNNIKSISNNGLKAFNYWTDKPELRDYYGETISDEGETPAFLCIELEDLERLAAQSMAKIEPDYPGLEEPISTVIRQAEEKVWAAWRTSSQDWTSSLAIIGSIRCPFPIEAEHLQILDIPSGELIQIEPDSRPFHKP